MKDETLQATDVWKSLFSYISLNMAYMEDNIYIEAKNTFDYNNYYK